MLSFKLFLLATLSLGCLERATPQPELFAEIVELCQPRTVVTIDTEIDNCSTNINGSIVCTSLAVSLSTIATMPVTDGRNSSCFMIEVPPGNHVITNPIYMGPVSIHMIGERNDSVISCGFDAEPPTTQLQCGYETNTNYTLYFREAEMVVFEGLSFHGCPLPFRLDTLRGVGVHNSTFQNFTEAVLDIFNTETVSISSSLFKDNRGTAISPCQYRGNTGAVAIGYHLPPESMGSPRVAVLESSFINNRATAENAFRTSSESFFSRVISGRGGGLGIFFGDFEPNASVEISDCLFERNYARSFGGGVYLTLSGDQNQHFFTLRRNHFIDNVGMGGGGAVQLSYLSNGMRERPHTAMITECVFDGNRGDLGGGIYVFPAFEGGDGNFARFERCIFRRNRGISLRSGFGTAIAFSLLNLFRERQSLPQYQIVDCWFESNSGGDGIVTTGYAPVLFSGNNTFLNNYDTSALRVIGTLVELKGKLRFINNTVKETEAALHLLSFGQVRMHRGLEISFEGNSGRFGASVLVETSSSASIFGKLAFNPLCFTLFEDTTALPSQWDNVTVSFSDNSAILASNLFIFRVDSCSFAALREPFFNTTAIVNWPVWKFVNDSRNTGYSDPYNIGYSVQTVAEAITTTKDSLAAWPGQDTVVHLDGRDQFAHSTTLSARFTFQQNFTTLQNQNITVGFEPQLVIVDNSADGGLLDFAFTMHYSISDPIAIDESLPLGTVIIDAPILPVEVQPASLTLYHRRCPGGYALVEVAVDNFRLECECKVNTTGVIHCEDDQDTIVIQNGFWAVYSPPPIDGTSERVSNMRFYPCPPSYCRCTQDSTVAGSACVYTYTNSNPNAQCSCGRTGVLCGECGPGMGKSALLNKCVNCHGASGLLIGGLIVLDVLVFVALVLIDIPLPDWVYPFLFYIQLAPYVSLYFSDTFETVGKFLHFFASGTSFYFIWDACLYGDMHALVSYTLRYIPLLVALLLSPFIILVRKKWRLLQHHGVWWVVLLLYSHTAHTSFAILDCPFLPTTPGAPSTPRWFVDGSVQCFTGGHVPLALFAILVILVLVALIPVVALVALNIQHPKKPLWIRHFVAPLQEVFREEMCWWAAIELSRRLVFLLFLTAFPRNIAVPIFLLCIYITVYGLVQPYRNSIVNVLEVGVLINFIILLFLQQTETIQDDYFTFASSSSNDSGIVSLTSNGSVPGGHECLSEVDSTAKIVWILMPFYYFPVLVLVVLAAIFFILLIRARWSSSGEADLDATSPDGLTLSRHRYFSSSAVMFQTVDLGPRTFTHGDLVTSVWSKRSTRRKQSRREKKHSVAAVLKEARRATAGAPATAEAEAGEGEGSTAL